MDTLREDISDGTGTGNRQKGYTMKKAAKATAYKKMMLKKIAKAVKNRRRRKKR